ncbi:MAG: hypothetical protein ACP5QR_14460 [Rhizomicrobium sp.]
MPRTALNSDDIKIEQKSNVMLDLDADTENSPEIVRADPKTMKDLAADLEFMEEPITIVLNPSSEKNAPTMHPFWVNGKGAEVLMNGKWIPMTYLPVGRPLITKRKYVGVMASAKFDSIETHHDEPGTKEVLNNWASRRTSAVTGFSVLEDKNPKGGAWLSELLRRNF